MSTESELLQDSTTVTTSSRSLARYRYDILASARIYIHRKTPPEDIQFQVNAIFDRGIAKERLNEVSSLAKSMSQKFVATTQGNRRGDDCVALVITALQALDQEEMFAFVRKVGIVPPLTRTVYVDAC